MAKYWEITGYDGLNQTWTKQVPHGLFNEVEMRELLKRLAARHLDQDEVLSSSLRRRSRGRTIHLDVHHDKRNHTLSTTGNPHYAARIAER